MSIAALPRWRPCCRRTGRSFTASGWREWLATITPTLLARELPFARGSFYSTTTGCERLDVVSEAVSKVPTSRHRYRRVVFDRDGLDAAVNGVQSLQLMLYNVFVECNQPQPPMGIKQWTARLTPEQRQVLTALPVAAPEHDSIAVGLRATGNAIRIAGRAAVTACGGTWPVDLDEGVQRFVDQSVPAP